MGVDGVVTHLWKNEEIMITTLKPLKEETGQYQAVHSADLAGESVPRRVLIAPWGLVESTNGSFVVDEESVRLAMEAFAEHATDLPIDYEHQTLGGTYSSPSGQAPAAGWIKALSAEPRVGLIAEIEWTEQGEKMLASKEYRYLSPVAIIRKRDRKLTSIHSAALTNKPAIVGMEPIVNRLVSDGELSNQIATSQTADSLSLLRAELNLPEDTETCEVLTAAGQRLAQLQRETKQRQIEERITEAMRQGKLVEAQRAWAEALVARETDLFDEWLKTAPVIVQRGRFAMPTDSSSTTRRELSIAAKARSEYRTTPMLQGITTEEAFVNDALREIERLSLN